MATRLVTNVIKAAGNCGEVGFLTNAPLTAAGGPHRNPEVQKESWRDNQQEIDPGTPTRREWGGRLQAPDATHININTHTHTERDN